MRCIFIVAIFCIFGCSQNNHSKNTTNAQEKSCLTTLDNLIYTDMFSRNYDTQHPLVCGAGRDFPNGKEIAFKQVKVKGAVHAVFPAVLIPPKEFNGKFTLYGYFQRIQNRDIYKFKKIKEDYLYFVVSSWGKK